MRTKERVLRCFQERLGFDIRDLKDASCLSDDLGMDSLDALELIIALEREFNVHICDEDAFKATTVLDVIRMIDAIAPARGDEG